MDASRENGDIGSLLVQSTRSPNYAITATIDPKNSGEKAEAGIALVGAAHNGFGAPIAAMDISVGNKSIKVWQTTEGTTEISGKSRDLKMIKVNGEEHHGYFVSHDLFRQGGEIEVVAN